MSTSTPSPVKKLMLANKGALNLNEEEGVGNKADVESGLRHNRTGHRRVRNWPRHSLIARDPPLRPERQVFGLVYGIKKVPSKAEERHKGR
jgi:hypothetical protein